MKNLEQLRASHALTSSINILKGKDDGDPSSVVKKVPNMIINHGLLATLAFALNDNDGTESVFKCVMDYLKTQGLISKETLDVKMFFTYLSDSNANQLRAVTTETMAYLSFLRRFVKKGA